RGWLSFATQKLDELAWLADSLSTTPSSTSQTALQRQRLALQARKESGRIHNKVTQKDLVASADLDRNRAPFAQRILRQQEKLSLPAYPTTTIGSFPQTPEIRVSRRDWKSGALSDSAYQAAMRKEIEHVIRFQERIGLDVLV